MTPTQYTRHLSGPYVPRPRGELLDVGSLCLAVGLAMAAAMFLGLVP